MDAHRHSTCISEPALLSNAQVKKRVSSLLRSVAFFPACPFRLEAVTKILTLLFHYLPSRTDLLLAALRSFTLTKVRARRTLLKMSQVLV